MKIYSKRVNLATIFFDTMYFELRQKLGSFLVIKIQKLKFSKNVNNEKCASKMKMKKINKKVRIFLGIENCQFLTFKVDYLCQKLTESFSIFFSLKNINLGAHFLLLTFF